MKIFIISRKKDIRGVENVKFDGNKFQVKDENDLKNLLYGIEQRLYTTPVTNKKMCASAVRAVGN